MNEAVQRLVETSFARENPLQWTCRYWSEAFIRMNDVSPMDDHRYSDARPS